MQNFRLMNFLNLQNKLICISIITLLFSCNSSKSTLTNRNDFYNIKFEINDNELDFYENVEMLIIDQNGDSYYVAKFLNGIYLPDIQEDEYYDLCFDYKYYKICFEDIDLWNVGRRWYFIIDDTPKDNYLTPDTTLDGIGYYFGVGDSSGSITKFHFEIKKR